MNYRKSILISALAFVCSCFTTHAAIEKSFEITKNYLNIPIQKSVARQRVTFQLDGEYLTHNDIRLADGKVDYWTFVDVSKYIGQTLLFEFTDHVDGIEQIYQSDQFVGEADLYQEKLRPQIHYTTRRGWTNDPNGMVFYDGEYHLFYQHNPYEIDWGNMTWGHAVSKDLLHWEELPIALLPDHFGTMFSGSAVIDYNNTAGFNEGTIPAMVSIYTADLRKDGKELNQQQCMAYSLDKGRTFTKYEGNPVIPSERKFGSGHERDPKVFWYHPGQHWVMILHEGINFCIYNSKDLKSWDRTCTIDVGFWECPELFELPVDGNLNHTKWVVYGVQGTYLIGEFDGKVFTPETELMRYNISGGMTAAQSYNDEPKGRRIQIGWGHANFPGMPFTQTFTFPMEFSLKTTRSGIRLLVEPICEIQNLYTKTHNFENVYVGDDLNQQLEKITNPLLHIKTNIKSENSRHFGLNINGYRLHYDVSKNQLNGTFIPLNNGELELEIIIDQTLIEVYVNGGRYYWFANHNADDFGEVKLSFDKGGSGLNLDPTILVQSLEIHELKSIWK